MSLRKLGSPTPSGSLGELHPERVLEELDRPTLFVSRFPSEQLALVYWIEEDEEGDVHLVVPTDDSIVEKLCRGDVTVREALDQPWAWLWFGLEARRIRIKELPGDCLPRSGVYLYPELMPLLSLRFTGDIEEHKVAASIIGRATEAVRGALKPLLDFLTKNDPDGRSTHDLRRLYDLPTHRIAYGSLEVDFGSPAQMDLLDDDKRLMSEAARLLQKGVDWAAQSEGTPLPEDSDEWMAILAALRHLVPPRTGPVQSVELAGKLTHRKIRLNRKATKNVIHALRSRSAPKMVQVDGYVREFDLDRLTFTVRSAPTLTTDEQHCTCNETLVDDVDYAFNTIQKVRVVGLREGGWVHAVFIGDLASERPTPEE
jgi:hypothetical protein